MIGYVDEKDINKRVKIIDNNDNIYIGKLKSIEKGSLNDEVFKIEFHRKIRQFNESSLKSVTILNS